MVPSSLLIDTDLKQMNKYIHIISVKGGYHADKND